LWVLTPFPINKERANQPIEQIWKFNFLELFYFNYLFLYFKNIYKKLFFMFFYYFNILILKIIILF
jgi:hypothetical protein